MDASEGGMSDRYIPGLVTAGFFAACVIILRLALAYYRGV